MGGIGPALGLVCGIGVVFYIVLAYLPSVVAGIAKGIVFKVRKGR